MRRRPLFIVEEDDESGASTRRPPRLGRTTRVATRFDSEEGGTILFFLFLCACICWWWSVGSAAVGRPCGSAWVAVLWWRLRVREPALLLLCVCVLFSFFEEDLLDTGLERRVKCRNKKSWLAQQVRQCSYCSRVVGGSAGSVFIWFFSFVNFLYFF